ncbi:MAG TPA: hemerythrin domain-containing protein [Chitinophagales bacterium]|nr:hemerythrin domain-containing protein [Chitinophagales bacterium]
MSTNTFETISEAIEELTKRGYTSELKWVAADDCLWCHSSSTKLAPGEFDIDEHYRIKEESNTGNERIVYTISSLSKNIKGVIVHFYDVYSDNKTSKTIELLNKHVPKKPIKRIKDIQPYSREHHHGLLLSWKIKTGFQKKVELTRIKEYVNWFYKTQILPHFEAEEKYLFPILGRHHPLIKQAILEHQTLRRLFECTSNLSYNLHQIETELNQHIRFEERVLFNEIQKQATPEQLKSIEGVHQDEKFVDNVSDPFWL